jgi:hypothetical protein
MTVETRTESPFRTLTQPKVAIVGFAEGHFNEAPFGQEGWECWGINRLHTQLPDKPWDVWYNLHDLQKFHGKDHEHLDWLKAFQGPVYLRPQDLGKYEIPNQMPFPWTELVKGYPPAYFNNTISWLIAFAISSGCTELSVTGVDMAQDTLLGSEYQEQRPSCEYFLGLAAGRGIGIHLPKGTDLLKATHLYGFEDPEPIIDKWMTRLQEVGQRKEQIKTELGQLENQRTQMIAAINQLDGAMQDVQWNLKNMRPQDLGLVYTSQNGKVESEPKETE